MTTQQLLILIAVLIVLVLAVVGILVAVHKRRSQGDSTRPGRTEEPGDGRSSLPPESATSAETSQAEGRPDVSPAASSGGQAVHSVLPASDASPNLYGPKGSAGSVASEAFGQSSSADQAAPSAQEELAHPEASASRMTRLKARLAKSPNPFGKALFAILTKDHLSESDWEDVEDLSLIHI